MSDPTTTPTAADLRYIAAVGEPYLFRHEQIALRAGADAMDERDAEKAAAETMRLDLNKALAECDRLREECEARRVFTEKIISSIDDPRLRAGLFEELARLREEYAAARSLLDTIADAPLKLDLARQTIARLQAELAETQRHWSEDTRDLNAMEAEIDRLRADRAALTVALAGLRYKDEPGRFCDHAAAPCTRCDRAAAALAEHGGE